jgi:hypothetical protein
MPSAPIIEGVSAGFSEGLSGDRLLRRPWLLPALLVLVQVVAGAGTGCVRIDGGAIEANWVVRTYDGRAMSGCGCADPAIARVRFVAAQVDAEGHLGADVCAGRSDCEFSCDSQRGATPFFVPAGRYAISISAIAPGGIPVPGSGGSTGVQLQAPILRDVVFGQPTQLEAFAIEANCANRCGGNQTTQACSAD